MEENENVTEEVTQETQDTQEKQEVEKPVVDESKFESAGDDSIIKVDLSKPVEDENQEETTEVADGTVDDTRVVGSDENSEPVQEQEKVQPEVEAQDAVLEEVTEEVTEEVEAVVEEVEEAIAEAQETGEPLPENIQKLIDFMGETGGTLEDYVNLNKDYSELDNMTALTEYYKRTKPHLDADEIEFLIEDSFNYDEELDE